MGIALRSAALSTSNISYVIKASLIGYALCRIASVLIFVSWKKKIGDNDWILGAVALMGAFCFFCHVVRGAAV